MISTDTPVIQRFRFSLFEDFSMRVFLSTVNITEQGTYCKRKLSFFIFSSYEQSECFIAEQSGLPRRNEMKTGAASYCGVKRNNASSSGVFYEAFCGVAAQYEAQLTLHEAALRAMKRSLFRLHVFLPKIWAKKWSG